MGTSSFLSQAQFDRPRERLLRAGAKALAEDELVAILLGSGSRIADVSALSRAILHVLEQSDFQPSTDALLGIRGVGAAGATRVMAALELGRRRYARARVSSPRDLLPVISFIARKRQEYLVCVSLSGAAEVIATRVVCIGGIRSVAAYPREIFADPIADRAAGIILAHNHPSGDPHPSEEDIEFTAMIANAGDFLGVELIDHVLLTADTIFSFKEKGLMPEHSVEKEAA